MLLIALKRQRITQVFGPPQRIVGLEDALTLVRVNLQSSRGGTSFLRSPATGAAAIYAIKSLASLNRR